MTRKRDAISYSSPYGGEWLKTRDVRKQHDKVLSLLTTLTTHAAWATARLEVRLPQSEALHRAYVDHLRHVGDPIRPTPRGRADLEAIGVPLDATAAATLDRFGPARVREWAGSLDDRWQLHHYLLEWEQERCATPADWFAHVEGHQAAKDSEGDPLVRLVLVSELVRWIDPATRAPLPFQEAEHYPPVHGAGGDCRVHAVLVLPRGTLLLSGRLPFERVDDAFLAYYREITAALGHPLSPKNFRAQLSSKDGTSTYDRKLPAWT